MRIDIRAFLDSIPAFKALRARVGLPDDPTFVEMANPLAFAACLDKAMRAFEQLRPGTQTLVDADVNGNTKSVRIRIVQNGFDRCRGPVETSLAERFDSLRSIAEADGGELSYYGGSTYLVLSLPYSGAGRQAYIELDHLPWSERYGVLLEHESWETLRSIVFRFSDLATMAADRCVLSRMS